ncbi:hypothetical protein JTE90_002431 [Oedothorax gibbosus]|uniref:Uncharacterized protein n=1 Tax=Oedothorax gibbosus TaxID=931172 RepID=A0AAV6UU83_9ARAC|nr:hypothetical protein JTE90_002431 [Oedothorax gibbosus]
MFFVLKLFQSSTSSPRMAMTITPPATKHRQLADKKKTPPNIPNKDHYPFQSASPFGPTICLFQIAKGFGKGPAHDLLCVNVTVKRNNVRICHDVG